MITKDSPEAAAQLIKSLTERVVDNVKKVIIGKDDAVRLMVIAVLSQGHVLLEDVPGLNRLYF